MNRRWVAFGADAEQDPPSSGPRTTVYTSVDVECFRFDKTGPVYYRFKCKPLVCGKRDCQCNTNFMMSFTPPGWDMARPEFGEYGNSMHPDYQGTKGEGFFVEQGDHLVWNKAKWRDGQPPNWDQEAGDAIATETG